MVGAEGASPQPTWPSCNSTRTIRFSALVIVTPAIFIGALSGKATGMASIRRTISGGRLPVTRIIACVFSSTALPQVPSGLMFAALMIGVHLSISALWNAPKPAGVICSALGISWPISASRFCTAGSASAPAIAALSLR